MAVPAKLCLQVSAITELPKNPAADSNGREIVPRGAIIIPGMDWLVGRAQLSHFAIQKLFMNTGTTVLYIE